MLPCTWLPSSPLLSGSDPVSKHYSLRHPARIFCFSVFFYFRVRGLVLQSWDPSCSWVENILYHLRFSKQFLEFSFLCTESENAVHVANGFVCKLKARKAKSPLRKKGLYSTDERSLETKCITSTHNEQIIFMLTFPFLAFYKTEDALNGYTTSWDFSQQAELPFSRKTHAAPSRGQGKTYAFVTLCLWPAIAPSYRGICSPQ